jgi:NADH-quinone oxidoreductase subunit J
VNSSLLPQYIAFAVFSLVAIASALATVTFRNPIRNAVSLFVHILSLAGLYITLAAHFLVAVQLIVYVGAVVVLFVFVIMMLGPGADTTPDASGRLPRTLGALTVVIIGMLIASTVSRFSPVAAPVRLAEHGTLRLVGEYLFNKAAIPFEVASVLLTAAIVGAFAVARAHHHKVKMNTETNPAPLRHLAGDAIAQGDGE